jgi:hypothetical protein
MNSTRFEIPVSTGRELAHPASPGGRHAQIVRIVCALRWRGWEADEIFHQVRPNYGPDMSDSEIWKIIDWRLKGPASTPKGRSFRSAPTEKRIMKSMRPEERAAASERFLQGFRCESGDLWEVSPCRLNEDWRKDASLLLNHGFSQGEGINIVTDYCAERGKARPQGFGKTAIREDWLRLLAHESPPESQAGAWVRMNPMSGLGTSDTNVTAFRFVLLEFDAFPESLQVAIFARLPLPVFAILTSGGKSVHAWIRIAAESVENYRKTVDAIFGSLSPLGIDLSNRNPSRLSRLPGARRTIGAMGDGRQRLLYLNPDAREWRGIL